MKNQKLTIAGLSLFILSLLSLTTVRAQTVDTRIGGMVAYGSEIENVGVGVNAEFGVLDKLSVSPSFIYYLPKEEGPVEATWFEINANANYYLLEDQQFDVYGLAGLNYTHVKVDVDMPSVGGFGGGSSSGSDSRFGLNLGAGANLKLSGGIMPFVELKYVIIDDGQLVAGAGVKFKL